MPFQFNWSKRRYDLIGYRQNYKAWVCSGKEGFEPATPLSLLRSEVARVKAEIERLYGRKNENV